jgi:hypothetical protein
MILIVTYDLRGAAGSYEDFFETLKAQGSWSHYLRSTWLISTDKDPSDIYVELRPYLRDGDHLLVASLSKDRQGWLPKKAWEWIKRHEQA